MAEYGKLFTRIGIKSGSRIRKQSTALVKLISLTSSDRRRFFAPVGTVDDRVLLFQLFKKLYFPTTFYFKEGEHSHLSDRLRVLATTRNSEEYYETLEVTMPGVGKTSSEAAMVAYRCIYGLESGVVYQSSVSQNVTGWAQTLLNMLSEPYLVNDFGELVPQSLANMSTAEKKRGQSLSSFVLNNGVILVSISSLKSFRGSRSVFHDLDRKPSYIIFDDTVTTTVSKSDVRKQNMLDLEKEAKRSRDPSTGIIRWLSNMTAYPNIAQDFIQSKTMPYVIIPASYPVIFYDGNEITEYGRTGSTNWTSKIVATDKEAAKINKKVKDTRFMVGSLEREKRVMGSAYDYEFECMLPSVKDRLFPDIAPTVTGVTITDSVFMGTTIYVWKDALEENVKRVIGSDIGLGRGGGDPSVAVCLDELYRVVMYAESNQIMPDKWAHVIAHMYEFSKSSVVTPENNSFGYATIAELRKLIPDHALFRDERIDRKGKPSIVYGFETTEQSKERMFVRLGENINKLRIPFDPVRQQLADISMHDITGKGMVTRSHNWDRVMSVGFANMALLLPKKTATVTFL